MESGRRLFWAAGDNDGQTNACHFNCLAFYQTGLSAVVSEFGGLRVLDEFRFCRRHSSVLAMSASKLRTPQSRW